MKIVIIGAGNVATVLGKLIKRANHEIIQVVSRNQENAALLAGQLGCSFSANAANIETGADMYLVAIADGALMGLYESYRLGDRLVVHTAGAVSMNVLNRVSSCYGVIYPLQSLRKENADAQVEIPFLVDGNAKEVINTVETFALSLSPLVAKSNDEQRLKLHVAAVLVSNFTNHLYAIAADYCTKERVDFRMLQPLIEETALRLRNNKPAKMQTGPAIRKDMATLDKHLRALSNHPKIKSIYLTITDSIMES